MNSDCKKIYSCIGQLMLLLLSVTKGIIIFESVNNYMGQNIIYYDQMVINTTNLTSYKVDNMMACRWIKNTTQSLTNPLNIVSVGTFENGSISCQIGYIQLNYLKLAPKLGTITFLSRVSNSFSPAKSGLFYHLPYGPHWQTIDRAASSCRENWQLPTLISSSQKDEFKKVMIENGLNTALVAATCSSTDSKWNDRTPFNYSLPNKDYGMTYIKYISSSDSFECGHGGEYIGVVCVLKIYSSPMNEF